MKKKVKIMIGKNFIGAGIFLMFFISVELFNIIWE
jgi:hypothetical protein